MHMNIRWFGLPLVAAMLVSVTFAQEDDTPKKKDTSSKSASKDKDKKGYSEKSAKAGEPFVAKLSKVEGAQRYLNVQRTLKIPQENTGAAQNLVNLQRQLIGNKDINSIINIRNEMAKNQAQLVTYRDEHKNMELQATDEMKVRTKLLPVEYDDKGKVRKLTDKEKKELKGPDPKLPGYTADFDSLKPEQMVEVYLEKSKSKTKKEKDSTSDKPRVVMIVILSEAAK